jgi:hypothetical protein
MPTQALSRLYIGQPICDSMIVKGVVEIIGDHIAIGGSIRRARRGVILGHGGDLFFFSLAMLFFWEGGQEK